MNGFDIYIFIVLLAMGYFVGSYLEKRHYQSIFKREDELQEIILITTKTLPNDVDISHGDLVTGSVVVSVDYFKRFVAGLRNLVGGRVSSYESLLDRGRREAILRMKADAQAQQSNMVFNVKLETASISKGAGNSIGSIEVLAYGTAIRR
ncbi:MAG: hypothetical protein ACI9J2_001791 [Saprospiraceae bacterium]|jgi:uncharacterized protein YbjQ (UPF0145 family)